MWLSSPGCVLVHDVEKKRGKVWLVVPGDGRGPPSPGLCPRETGSKSYRGHCRLCRSGGTPKLTNTVCILVSIAQLITFTPLPAMC